MAGRKCRDCGATLGRYARTNVCRRCRNKTNQQREQRRKECPDCGATYTGRRRRCDACAEERTKNRKLHDSKGRRCEACGEPVDYRNKSGFCARCYRKHAPSFKRSSDALFGAVDVGLRTSDEPYFNGDRDH